MFKNRKILRKMNELKNQTEITLIKGIKALNHVRDENDKKIEEIEKANDDIFEKLTSLWLAQANLAIAAKQQVFAVYEFDDVTHPNVLAGVFLTREEAQKRVNHINNSTCIVNEPANETHLNYLVETFMEMEY